MTTAAKLVRIVGLALGSAPFLFGCTTPMQVMRADVVYRKEMKIQMDGLSGTGVLVVPQAARHNFSVTAPDKMALYVFSSCHRENPVKNLGSTVEGYFSPNPGIEDEPGCTVEWRGFNGSAAQFTEGLADFQDDQTRLAHRMMCNGDVIDSQGVTVCQTREGLEQLITFPEAVFVGDPAPGCPKLSASDRRVFKFPAGLGTCIYKFESVADKSQHARLTTLGYQNIRF